MSDADNTNRVNAGVSASSATTTPSATPGFTPEALAQMAQMSQMFLPFMEMFRNSMQPGN